MFLSPRVFPFKGGKQGEGAVTSVHLDHRLQGLNAGSSSKRMPAQILLPRDQLLSVTAPALLTLSSVVFPLKLERLVLSEYRHDSLAFPCCIWMDGHRMYIIRGTCPMLIIALSVQENYKKSINSLITPTVFVYIADETSGSVPWRSIN